MKSGARVISKHHLILLPAAFLSLAVSLTATGVSLAFSGTHEEPATKLSSNAIALNAGNTWKSAPLGARTGACPAPSFSPPTNYPVDDFPTSATSADFNNDGNLDLATANNTNGTVSVLLGNGTGGFGPVSNFPAGSDPSDITSADLNEDGNVDLAVARAGSFPDNISVLFGNGAGGFSAPLLLTAGTTPDPIRVGDFNNDGNLDLVASNLNSANVSVFLGNGAGGFGPPTNFPVAPRPQGLEIGDLNEDGNLDLAVSNNIDFAADTISVLLGNGTGGFGPPAPYPAGEDIAPLVLGDYNEDSHLDVAVRSGFNIAVLLGNGSGAFGSPVEYPAGGRPISLVARDFTLDGHLDLASANNIPSNVSVLMGNGTGGFAPPVLLPAGSSPFDIDAGDFNEDGRLDLAVPNAGSDNVSVLLNNCQPVTTGTPATTSTVAPTHTATQSATPAPTVSPPPGKIVFQSNRDGNFDIFTMESDGSNPTNISNNSALDVDPSWSPDGTRIAFSSDRDGNNDIYVMNANGSNVTRLTLDGAANRNPAWSPDGTRIVFQSERTGDREIWVMNADGSNSANLTNNPSDDEYPAWSPDGTRIAFQTNRDGFYQIYSMDANGSNQTNLTSNPDDNFSPDWSPDGTRIVFTKLAGGNEDVYVMNANGSNQTRLATHPASDADPAWSPDGTHIVFSSFRVVNFEIYRMNADGSNVTRLTIQSALDLNPDWQPLGGPSSTPTVTVAASSTSVSTSTPTTTRTATRTPTRTPGTPVATATACTIQFADVPPGHTFYTHVRCLACQGIIGGYPCGGTGEPCNANNDPYFRLNNNITRGQIAKIVSESAGFTEPAGNQIYEDVPSGSSFYLWINRLSNRGVMGGYLCGVDPNEPCGPENRPYFRPSANATRGQISKIVSEAAGFDEQHTEQTFEDVPTTNTFYIWVERLVSRQIMGGYPCGSVGEPCGPENRPYFRWGNTVTRGQASKIVANTFFPGCNPQRR